MINGVPRFLVWVRGSIFLIKMINAVEEPPEVGHSSNLRSANLREFSTLQNLFFHNKFSKLLIWQFIFVTVVSQESLENL